MNAIKNFYHQTHSPTKMKNSCQTEIYFLQIEMRNANDVKDVADDDVDEEEEEDDDGDVNGAEQQQNVWREKKIKWNHISRI